MVIIGVGTDIVQIDRIDALYKKFGDKFLYKNYHSLEIETFNVLNDQKKVPFLAKRFAGKEAITKALGTGIGSLGFKDIAIINNNFGAPFAKIFADINNEYKIHVSLSDDYPFAIAFVIITN